MGGPNHQAGPGALRVELADGERRLYELARTGTPLAEIGVRLGLPVAEVDRRLDLLVTRLGLADRLALRDPPAEDVITDMPSADSTPPLPPPASTELSHRFSRRSLVIGGAAAGAAALAGGAALLALRSDRGSGPASGATPTAPGGSSPTASSTAQLGQGLGLIQPLADAYERRTFAPGTEIAWRHGIFFMDVDSGEVEGWRLAPAYADPNAELLFTYRLPGARYIEMLADPLRILVDRETGVAWQYPSAQLRLVAAQPGAPTAPGRMLFEELDGTDGAPARSTGRYIVATADLAEQARFAVPPPRFPPDPLLSLSSDRAVALGFSGESYSLHLFNLSDGAELAMLPLPLPSGRQLSLRWIDESPVVPIGQFGIELVAYEEGGGEVKVLRAWLPWSSDWPQALSADFDDPRSVFFDATGSVQLIQRSLRDLPAESLGGGETWPMVEVADRLGQPRARIRSASLFYGDVIPNRRFSGPWFFTMTASAATEGPGFDRVGYTAWNAETLNSLPVELPPRPGDQWYDSNQVRGPIPDPRSIGVVALGRFEVAHLDLGERDGTGRVKKHLRANVTSTSGADHVDPWCGNPGEMVFVLAHGGHDGGWPSAMIAPKVERPPFDDSMRFRVARAGDCLNLRDGPSLTSRITTCIPDGTPLVLWDDATGATQPGRTFERNQDGAWVAVRLADGTGGWVSSAYLDWA